MFAVLGATGQVGGAVIAELVRGGQKVRAVVRNADKAQALEQQGVELAIGDLHDANALKAAFAGTQGAFVMTPPYYDSATPIEENRRAITAVVEAAHESGVPKLVLLSSIGAHLDHGTGAILKLHEAERELLKLGMPVASIRAAWFMENFRGVLGPAAQTGTMPSFLYPLDRAQPMIATRDIGAKAAELLTSSWPGKRVIELEGPRRYAPLDVARALSAVLARPIEAQPVPQEHWTGMYRSWGMTPNAAAEMAAMIEGFNSGWIRFEEANAEHARGATELQEVFAALVKQS